MRLKINIVRHGKQKPIKFTQTLPAAFFDCFPWMKNKTAKQSTAWVDVKSIQVDVLDE